MVVREPVLVTSEGSEFRTDGAEHRKPTLRELSPGERYGEQRGLNCFHPIQQRAKSSVLNI